MSLNTGLISWWDLDEPDGVRADSVGRHHLSDSTDVATAEGKTKTLSALFDASSSQFLSRADHNDLSLGLDNKSFTVAGWFYLSTAAHTTYAPCTIFAKSISGDREHRLYYDDSSEQLKYIVYKTADTEDATVSSTEIGTVSREAWHFFRVWYDYSASQIGIQIDDNTVDEETITGPAVDSAAPFLLGAENTTGSPLTPFDGRLQSIGVWNRTLTAAEHTSLYNSGNGQSYASLQNLIVEPWTAYASVADMFSRYDVRTIANLCSDHGQTETATTLANNRMLRVALHDASGDIESALTTAGRYTVADLSGLTGNSLSKLKNVTCQIAMSNLMERRPSSSANKLKEALELRESILERLRNGTNIFNLPDTVDAGLPDYNLPEYLSSTESTLSRKDVKHYYPVSGWSR